MIDSHHHLWNYDPVEYGWIGEDMDVLKRDYLPVDLATTLSGTSVTGVITVQARQTLEETHWLLGMAKTDALLRGVVGWVPLVAPDLEKTLESLANEPFLKGVRHVLQAEPNDELILSDPFNRGIEQLGKFDLAYDILIKGHQLAGAIHLADRHPEQVFVLDHIAKPTIQNGRFDAEWAEHFRELAKRENVFCKFSGVVTEVTDTDWSIDTIRPYWETALDTFGPERLMFGSDWPVCLLRASYDRWLEAVATLTTELSKTEHHAFQEGNAIRAYRLDSV